jgi:hypothetical protein
MDWEQAVSGPLVGCTCLWQDLDGLHVESAPSDAPPTSILWGWGGGSVLVRVRLDREIAYVAVHDPASSAMVRVVPWSSADGRVAAARGPERADGGVGAPYEQIIVGGIDSGPITFVRPVRDA